MIIEIIAENSEIDKHNISVRKGEKATVTHAYSSGVIDIKMVNDNYEVSRIPMCFTNYKEEYFKQTRKI